MLLRKTGGVRGERFALPGGAQDVGEILEDALQRECLEEIGVGVQIESLLFVADFFKCRDTEPVSHKHLVEFIFRCRVPDDYTPGNGPKPDRSQVEVVWMPLASLDTISLYPSSMASILRSAQNAADGTVYLGLID